MNEKLIAEWFWIDRWIGSSAFLMPLEARGLYREMLTQAWRRGAKLPADHPTIKRAVAATDDEWNRTWPFITTYWRESGGVLINDTQVEIYSESRARAERASDKGVKGARARWGNGRG